MIRQSFQWPEEGRAALFLCAFINSFAFILFRVGVGFSIRRLGLLLATGMIVVSLFAFGWVSAYYMAIIRNTAGGDDRLPNSSLSGTDSTAATGLGHFVLTWFCLLLPAMLLATARSMWNLNIPDVWIHTLMVFALVMWPMGILCVSIGGISVFFRFDLMVYSVLATFWAYVVVWVILLAAVYGGRFAIELITLPTPTGAPAPFAGHPLAATALIAVLITYISIVAMKAIGLYYRHFKHRFAWSWE